jgi:effector-binding domain-containing protein
VDIALTTLHRRHILGVRDDVALTELPQFFGRALERVSAVLGQEGARPSGPPVALYYGGDEPALDVVAGFPFTGDVTPPPGTIVVDLPECEAAEAMHVGSYDDIDATYRRLSEWMAERDLVPADIMWEEYLAGPQNGSDPSTWRTRVVYPIA